MNMSVTTRPREVTSELLAEFMAWTRSADMFLSSPQGEAFGAELRSVLLLAAERYGAISQTGEIVHPSLDELLPSPEAQERYRKQVTEKSTNATTAYEALRKSYEMRVGSAPDSGADDLLLEVAVFVASDSGQPANQSNELMVVADVLHNASRLMVRR
jgi:hypothetical protein